MTTSKPAPLVKQRSHTITVEVGRLGARMTSDASWTTSDGYLVVRTISGPDLNVDYWVRDLTSRWTTRDTLKQARESIQWCRDHGR